MTQGGAVPDDGAWMGSGLGMNADGELTVYCDEPSHAGSTVDVRRLRRGEGAGWWINPNTDMYRVTREGTAPGDKVEFRARIELRCPGCDLNVELTGVPGSGGNGAMELLDRLVDGGVSRISLRRLCALVSNWR